MRFSSLKLYRFMSHVDSMMDFSPGINIFIGESDEGKSVIVRAINLVLNNRPTGAQFITYGYKHGFCALGLDNAKTIIRGRRGKENYYVLLDETKKEFRAFGTSVPEDIQEAYNIKKVTLDEQTHILANLSKQHDPPFLVSESDGLKAKAVGKLNGTNIVDISIQDITKDILTINAEKRSMAARIEELDALLENYSYLPKLGEFVKQALSLVGDIRNSYKKLDLLNHIFEKRRNFLSLVDMSTSTLNKLKNVGRGLEIYNTVHNTATCLSNLDKLFKTRQTISLALETVKNVISNAGIIHSALTLYGDLEASLSVVHKLCSLATDRKKFMCMIDSSTKFENLASTINCSFISLYDLDMTLLELSNLQKLDFEWGIVHTGIRDIERKINLFKSNVSKFKDRYESALRSLKVCPTCNRPIDKNFIGQSTLF